MSGVERSFVPLDKLSYGKFSFVFLGFQSFTVAKLVLEEKFKEPLNAHVTYFVLHLDLLFNHRILDNPFVKCRSILLVVFHINVKDIAATLVEMPNAARTSTPGQFLCKWTEKNRLL